MTGWVVALIALAVAFIAILIGVSFIAFIKYKVNSIHLNYV